MVGRGSASSDNEEGGVQGVSVMGWCGKERNAGCAMSYCSAAANESNVPQARPWRALAARVLRVRYVSSHRCLTVERGRK